MVTSFFPDKLSLTPTVGREKATFEKKDIVSKTEQSLLRLGRETEDEVAQRK
ncbi:MAG: hypothetical protein HYW85_07235 [Deltaproteobacteria bacterium]|nr:hypothetical protein [Deltaproteobacteria bacterium]MBI3016988.1 hypothetical protein [Deltaproteobacteria bacterium]